MTKEQKLFYAYQKNPVEGITAKTIDGDGCARCYGIHFKSTRHTSTTEVNIYVDGEIAVPGFSAVPTQGMNYLRDNDPELYKLAKAAANDFKIMALMESCTDSLLYETTYDPELVDTRLKEWEETTGCIVFLNEEQKADLYDRLIRYDKEPGSEPTTSVQITCWLQNNRIPFLHTGEVKFIVSKDARIQLNVCLDRYDNQENAVKTYTYELNEVHNPEAQFEKALDTVRNMFNLVPGNKRLQSNM